MSLREFILSDENIYLAIYSVKSYVFDPELLDMKNKKLLRKLSDPFDEEVIFPLIKRVRKNI